MIMQFDMTIFHYGYRLILLPIILCSALWLTPTNAQAAISVTCTANMSNVNLGSITPENADSAPITGTLSYSCTNKGSTAGYVSVCMAVDGGSTNSGDIDPRYMISVPGSGDKLAFNMTLPSGAVWGKRDKSGTEYSSGSLPIAANQGMVSGQAVINIDMIPNRNNTQSRVGTYKNNFDSSHTELRVNTSTDGSSFDCSKGETQGTTHFPFTVNANVIKGCVINTSSLSVINLGSHLSGATNLNGTGRINLTCTNAMPYYVGLTPFNQDTNGAGVMSGTGANPDKIPYQLRSKSGLTGTPWGNTATATTQGNGVSDTGNGQPRVLDVYVTVPKTNVRPDSYSDRVTVTVYY
ncbi:spore coat protein U domain-containing protein [Psychrobacter sp. 16-MNA-CIBAN-0192]|uniref:Csu type fimbrial protein n=1 Tax=Psychrobacter sp. 16-MNA-CIBAN-0192 TaxID=3140448 RepID=UPI00331B086C